MTVASTSAPDQFSPTAMLVWRIVSMVTAMTSPFWGWQKLRIGETDPFLCASSVAPPTETNLYLDDGISSGTTRNGSNGGPSETGVIRGGGTRIVGRRRFWIQVSTDRYCFPADR